jgi:hypothetical protein
VADNPPVSHVGADQLYLRDLGFLLKEMALEAKSARDAAKGTEGSDYAEGKLMAFYAVISLMRQQATAFGIEASALNLHDVDPERDLL